MQYIGIGIDHCAKELNQNAEEIKEKHKSGNLESIDKCLINCVLKRDGTVSCFSFFLIKFKLISTDSMSAPFSITLYLSLRIFNSSYHFR